MFKFFGKRNTAALAALVVAAVAGVGAYAFTASNTVPASAAGSGTQTVDGYTVGTPSYTFSDDGVYIDEADFSVTGAEQATAVDAALTATSTPVKADWLACTVGATTGTGPYVTAVTCDFTAKNITAANGANLGVLAVSNGATVTLK